MFQWIQCDFSLFSVKILKGECTPDIQIASFQCILRFNSRAIQRYMFNSNFYLIWGQYMLGATERLKAFSGHIFRVISQQYINESELLLNSCSIE
jgi:hypothetical protein